MDTIMMLSSEHSKKKAGRKKFKETRHPVYRGVRSRNSGKWVCEVRQPITQTRVWLGTHPTAEMAARAHDVAVLAMRGPTACLNFADSVWRLPIPESSNIIHIQKAAAAAAEAFRHTVVVVEIVEPTVACYVEKIEVVINDVSESLCFVDDDDIFGIPGFFASMAQGLMIPPPQSVGYGKIVENIDFCVDTSLWI